MRKPERKIRTVGGIKLDVTDEIATIARDVADDGNATQRKHGPLKIAVVRHFLNYYRLNHDYSWNDIIEQIEDWTLSQEKYDFLDIRIDNNSIRKFGGAKNVSVDPYSYNTPIPGCFDLILDFLMSESSGPWITSDIFEKFEVERSIPTMLASVLEGKKNEGGAKRGAEQTEGTYHAHEQFQGGEKPVEFHLIRVQDSPISRSLLRVLSTPVGQIADKGRQQQPIQFFSERNEAVGFYGWLINIEFGPSLGLLSYYRGDQSILVQLVAKAKIEPKKQSRTPHKAEYQDLILMVLEGAENIDSTLEDIKLETLGILSKKIYHMRKI